MGEFDRVKVGGGSIPMEEEYTLRYADRKMRPSLYLGSSSICWDAVPVPKKRTTGIVGNKVGELRSWCQVMGGLEYLAKQCGPHFLSGGELCRFAQMLL